ncbi:MAG: prolipoprotein diacylglyceryl transferase [Nanoarchaeota archaeon]|nr:prolipoprotein diacylglyceryl transferase [Nanoarchaeota archaeon]
MFIHSIDPVLFSIGPLEIRYYGLVYVIGFLLLYFLLPKLAKQKGLKLSKEDASDLIIYLVIGVIAGARLFHVFVYNPSYYLSHPAEILAVWQGGLSFHGGFLGAVTAGWLFCRKKKFNLLDLADLTVIPLGIALGLGRIANFINAELYGFRTGVPWAVKFPNAEGFRHPSQLYESAKNFFIFGVLWNVKNLKLPRGALFTLFTFMYGVLRFSVEFFRERENLFLNISTGQWLSLGMIIFSVVFYFMYVRKNR